uniref:Uncharacterized protein n=1 Tax=Bartonella rochalimae ATCC BAA-1498 TaxID=685782 RepID=E6YLQ6_9HYPH|nr:hypothetical protein BARRO_50157 [Bartonella rochalimae ATCC BAA-1498]
MGEIQTITIKRIVNLKLLFNFIVYVPLMGKISSNIHIYLT